MAAQMRKRELELRLDMMEAQMDVLEGRLEDDSAVLANLTERVEKLEVWFQQKRKARKFFHALGMQESASVNKIARPAEDASDSVRKRDVSVEETECGDRLLEMDKIELETKCR
jgi:flagellar biosynthesis chaperone FliJ